LTGRSRESCARGVRVKELNKSFKLLGMGFRVLKSLGAGNTATDAARDLGCSKANVTYWKNKLLDMDALRIQCRDVFITYSLTPFGLKLLTGSENGLTTPVVLEDHAFKFAIVEHEKNRIDWRKLGQPQNWDKLGFKIGKVRVVKTSRNIIIHPGKLRGFDVDELEVTAGRIIERVKAFLENRYGMVLGEEGVPLHKPIWEVFTPEAEEWAKAGTVKVEGVGQLDKSPPDRKAHREYDRKQLAIDAIMAPVVLADIERKVDALTESTEKMAVSIGKLSDALSKLFNLEEDQNGRSVPSEPRRFDYVS
jgi:hypothetical protein